MWVGWCRRVQRQPKRRLASGGAERNALRLLLVCLRRHQQFVRLVRVVRVVGGGVGVVGGFHKFIIDI